MPINRKRTYSMVIQSGTLSPVDATTYYVSPVAGVAPTTTYNDQKQIVPITGTIQAAQIHCICTAATGTNEAWAFYIRVNDATDYLIESVSLAVANRYWKNNNLNIPIVAGDFISLKVVCPTWGTNPDTCRFGGIITVHSA